MIQERVPSHSLDELQHSNASGKETSGVSGGGGGGGSGQVKGTV